MSDLTDDLRKAATQIAAAEHDGWGNTCSDAADEIDRLTAERDALREQVAVLESLLVDADNICQEHGGCDLHDCIDNDGALYQSQGMADALKAARAALKGER